ncbi:MAG: immune inhibitor A domain-containing protein, partial [Dehalococcoidia bacterium]
KSALDRANALDRKFASGNPRDARQLAKLEAKAIKTGKSPRQIKQAKSTQEAQLLTILVEFNEAADDDFTGVKVPETVFESRDCVDGTVQNGPLHNNIPNPASYSHADNNTFWVPDFSPEHFNNMLYTKEGITERVRPDLTGPDGQPGIDISGYTMKNMYEEMSKGAYTVDGSATPWVTVPHSEGWYGASRCFLSDAGTFEAGAIQSMNGHPDNPGGPGTMATDAVDALAASQPDFPWADYDVEDQGDIDGDGNFLEPDGIVDHLVLVHAGEDKSGGGGAQGVYAIWAHSSTVAGGHEVPGTDIEVWNYIVQPEDSGVGVFAHEYGHDLGLPDLYDTSGNGESAVDFWDLMSTGSHSGPIFQSLPTHMGLWDKWVLGWADPLILTPGAAARNVQLGQTSRTPRGT